MDPDKSLMAIACLSVVLFLSGCDKPRDLAREDLPDRQADEAAIRSLLVANFEASTAHDAAGVAATYMPGGDAWIAGMPRVAGHERVRELEEDFGGIPGFQSYDGTIEGIRFISRDAAIAEVSGITTLDTGRFEEKTTIVIARTEGEWKIAAWRVMMFDETLLSMLKDQSRVAEEGASDVAPGDA